MVLKLNKEAERLLKAKADYEQTRAYIANVKTFIELDEPSKECIYHLTSVGYTIPENVYETIQQLSKTAKKLVMDLADIGGVTFSELSDKGKESAMNALSSLDDTVNYLIPDYKERLEITQVFRFEIGMNINDKDAIAKITMFENNEAGNKIYSLELEELESASLSPSTSLPRTETVDKAQFKLTTGHESLNIAKSNTNNSTQKKLTNTAKTTPIQEKDLQKVIKGEYTEAILTEQN